MKTIEDLRALYPTIIDEIVNDTHEFGETYYGPDGWEDYEDNFYTYEEDGWLIEIVYRCTGIFVNDPGDYWTPPCHDLEEGWGNVAEMSVTHYDEETGDETVFEDDDLCELNTLIDKALSNLYD